MAIAAPAALASGQGEGAGGRGRERRRVGRAGTLGAGKGGLGTGAAGSRGPEPLGVAPSPAHAPRPACEPRSDGRVPAGRISPCFGAGRSPHLRPSFLPSSYVCRHREFPALPGCPAPRRGWWPRVRVPLPAPPSLCRFRVRFLRPQ